MQSALSHTETQPADVDLLLYWVQGPDEVSRFRALLHEQIATAYEQDGTSSVEVMVDEIESGEAGAYLIIDEDGELYGTCVIRTVDYEVKRVLECLTATGHHFDRWGVMITDELNRMAKQQGCDLVRVYVRPGLARKLSKLDCDGGKWKRKLEVMEYVQET